MSGTSETPAAIDLLIQRATRFAGQMLPDHEDLMPVAHVLRADGRAAIVAAAGETDTPSTGELLQNLLYGLRQQFADGELLRCAICLDGRIRSADGEATDALLVWVEAPGEPEVAIAVPYYRRDDRSIEFGDVVNTGMGPLLFADDH